MKKTLCPTKPFGRLVAIRMADPKPGGRRCWECRCDCGRVVVRLASVLLRRLTNSCGCIATAKTVARCRTHGHAPRKRVAPEYRSWCAMIRRCEAEKDSHYYRYGGRGIKVCRRWRASFAAFLADMGPKPAPHYEIDREDNDGDYEPGNCRWVPQIVNAKNRSTNRRITANGKTMILADWAEELGIPPSTLSARFQRGYSDDEAINLPYGGRRKLSRPATS